MNADQEQFLQTIRDLFIEPDRREIFDWGHDFIDFGSTEGFKGHYSVENTPWTRDLLKAFRNPYVREMTFIAPPRYVGKTMIECQMMNQEAIDLIVRRIKAGGKPLTS